MQNEIQKLNNMKHKLLSEGFISILETYKENNIANIIIELDKKEFKKGYTRHLDLKEGEMTYTPKRKDTIVDFKSWGGDRRSGRYGRVLRKVLVENSVTFVSSELENLVNLLKVSQFKGEFKILRGEKIADVYMNSLGLSNEIDSSCMNGKPREYFDLYTENSQVSILVYIEDETLLGRALVWEDKYMDIVYGKDCVAEAFNDYAKYNGLYNLSNRKPPEGQPKIDWKREISGIKTNHYRYPYVDSFCYVKFGDEKTGMLFTYYNEKRDDCLQDEYGGTDNKPDPDCEEDYYEDDYYYDEW